MKKDMIFNVESQSWWADEKNVITDIEITVPINIFNSLEIDNNRRKLGLSICHLIDDKIARLRLPRFWTVNDRNLSSIIIYDDQMNKRIIINAISGEVKCNRRFNVRATLNDDGSRYHLCFSDIEKDIDEVFVYSIDLIEKSKKVNGKDYMDTIDYLIYLGEIVLDKMYPDNIDITKYWKTGRQFFRSTIERRVRGIL